MEISSSNFHLKPDGSVIISGSTTTEVNISKVFLMRVQFGGFEI